MPSSPRPRRRLALAALLAPALALGQAPATAAAAPEPPPIPVAKGSVVRVDLSRVPRGVARRGAARCAASRIDATGAAQELVCQQPFTFEGPFTGEPVLLVFQPAGGGRATRLEYPLQWDPHPRTFTAPAAGALLRPGTKAAAGPVPLPPALQARAREAGAAACRQCPGPGPYTLRDVTVEPTESPAAPVEITVAPPGSAP